MEERTSDGHGFPLALTTLPPGGLALRLAIGLGDADLERALLPVLSESGDFVVVERCLAADQLVGWVQRERADVALVSSGLHRLGSGSLDQLARTRLPVVLLAPDPSASRWMSFPGVVLPVDADPEAVRQALHAAIRGERPRIPAASEELAEELLERPSATNEEVPTALSLLAVASGPGSPGRTTVALNLAVALGAVAPTILVDSDLSAPSLAAYLDADPTRNLSMLAHAEPQTPREWERAITQETQPLAARSPQGLLLAGVPKPEMRTGITPAFFVRMVAELRQRFSYVVLDLGSDLFGADAAVQRAALAGNAQVLLVTGADLVSLSHARTALGFLQDFLDPARIGLIVNGHERRYHHARPEIEWALGVPAAAMIPYDRPAVQRALMAQRPLVLDSGSRAARALLDLAERIHGGTVVLPVEASSGRRVNWLPRFAAPRLPWSRGAVTPVHQESPRC